jgi:hypothetical protein
VSHRRACKTISLRVNDSLGGIDEASPGQLLAGSTRRRKTNPPGDHENSRISSRLDVGRDSMVRANIAARMAFCLRDFGWLSYSRRRLNIHCRNCYTVSRFHAESLLMLVSLGRVIWRDRSWGDSILVGYQHVRGQVVSLVRFA